MDDDKKTITVKDPGHFLGDEFEYEMTVEDYDKEYNTKWNCPKCNAINPMLSYKCHNCKWEVA